MILFEQLLQEGSKKRFIDQIWNELEYDSNSVMALVTPNKPHNGNQMPTREEITKWVDSGAANSFLQKSNFNWQNFAAGKNDKNGVPLYVDLIRAYLEYKSNGGSRTERKEIAKKDPTEVFIQSGLKVCHQGQDTSGYDLVIMDKLENSKWIFVVPLNWEACKFMDSFGCGGQGAQWCIGYEKEPGYWEEHTEKGELFILAYTKNPNPEKDKLKYMITLSPNDTNDTQAWKQPDDPEDTIPLSRFKKFFGWDPNEMVAQFVPAICCDDNPYGYNAIGKWYESFEDFDQIEFYHEEDLVDNVFYYSEFSEYTPEMIYQKAKKEREMILDFEGATVDPKVLHADNNNGNFDIPTFLEFLNSCKVDKSILQFGIEFKNGKFDSVWYEPEAFPYGMKFWFGNCDIGKLYYCDYSDASLGLVIEESCSLGTLHWCSDEDSFYCLNVNSFEIRVREGSFNEEYDPPYEDEETYNEENEMEKFNESKKLKEENDSNFIFSKTINDLIEDNVERVEFTVFGKKHEISFDDPELKRIYYMILDTCQIYLIDEEYWSEPLYQIIEKVVGTGVEYDDLQAKKVSNRVRESKKLNENFILNRFHLIDGELNIGDTVYWHAFNRPLTGAASHDNIYAKVLDFDKDTGIIKVKTMPNGRPAYKGTFAYTKSVPKDGRVMNINLKDRDVYKLSFMGGIMNESQKKVFKEILNESSLFNNVLENSGYGVS